MSRFFCLPREVQEGKIIIEQAQEAHHIIDVMRQKAGDKVTVFDGSGKQYNGIIKEASPRKIIINILSTVTAQESAVKICLACAIPKKAKFDFIAQKATELGVDEIIPMITQRTIIKIGPQESPKLKRWRKISIEAAKQCGRKAIPEISKALTFKEAVARVKDFDLAVIPNLAEDRRDLKALDLSNVKSVIIFIGPEGDFTPEEIDLALSSGCIPVSLGCNVLKVDTAAIFSVGILAYLLKKL